MATAPCFHWPHHSPAAGAPDSDAVAGFGLDAPDMVAPSAADTALLAPPDHRAAPGRPRMRRSSHGKQQQQKGGGGGGAKKPPQRGLGVAELERLRCGGDPLRELAGAAQVRPLVQCNHIHLHQHHAPAAAFDARYCSSLLVPPAPAAPGCRGDRAASLAPEQQFFVDRWGRMGPGFGAGGGDHRVHQSLLLAPEHPSSQSTIWRPAASSSSCLHSGHRCDLCARTRMARSFAEGGAARLPSVPPLSPTIVPDYSIYDLATAMATTRQGEAAFQLVRDRKRGAFVDEAPAKKEVREIEFFPAASAHHHTGGGGIEESEFVASLHYAAPPLDLSLRL